MDKKLENLKENISSIANQIIDNKVIHTKNPTNEEILSIHKYYQEGKIDLAEKLALAMSKKFPKHQFSWKVLGVIYKKKGRLIEALKVNERAINLNPNDAEVLNNLGVTLKSLERLKEAEPMFRKALLLKANYSDAHYNLGNTLKALGKLNDAEKSFCNAIKINPNNFAAYNNLGNTLKELGKLDEAITWFSKAITLNPLYAEAYNNLGVILLTKNSYKNAIKMFEQAIYLCKKTTDNDLLLASSYKNKGLGYLSLNEFDKVRDNFMKALSYNNHTQFADGFVCYSKLYCADWNKLDYYKSQALKKVSENKMCITPFCSFSITDDPAIQLKVARMSNKDNKVNNNVPFVKENYLKNTKHTKPRVAYLSYDFCDHATMHLMAGVFEHQDHNRFDYYAFSYSDESNNGIAIFNRVRQSFKNFNLVTEKRDIEICQMLKDKEIDIVVDLKGHTHKTRMGLLSKRPCPIQVTFLGHPGTTGTNFIDYAIVDDFIVNSENEPFFSEKVLKLPNCYQPTDNKRYFPNKKLSKADLGLPEDKFIFCSFNSPYKIQPEMFNVWMEILNSKEDSVLWLLENEKSESTKNILEHAQKKGIASNRIIYTKRCDINEYLDKLHVADLFLDTFPINAHTTASDALWVGLPVLTLAGKSMVSRVAGSLLNNINMQDLITYNYDDYKNMALKLSNNKTYFDKIKNLLKEKRLTSPLFDTKQYTKDLEDIYNSLYTNFKNSF